MADLDHDSYGNPETSVESVSQPFRFTGREYDTFTGLYHYRAREYDPASGRFLQEDPIWFNAGDKNVYRYVLSNPVKYRDPRGTSVYIEYGCLAQFGAGAGTSAGATAGGIGAGLFTTIALALAQANEDQEAADQALRVGAMAISTVALIAEEVAANMGGCGKVAKPRPKFCKSPRKPNSFGGDTVVLTRNGLKPIADVEVGDEVAAYDQSGDLKSLASGVRETAWRKVTGKSSRETNSVMRLTVRGEDNRQETITVTGNHPYLRPANDNSKGILNLVNLEPFGLWTSVLNLKPGDELVSALGNKLVVDTIEKVEGQAVRVYDLEVEGLHSFAVGGLGAWVHNAIGPLTGYTGHGLNQVIDREGSGVCPLCILNAIKDPKEILASRGGTKKFIGNCATVILSESGKLITAYGRPRGR